MEVKIDETFSIVADLRCWILKRRGYRTSRDGTGVTEFFDEFFYPNIEQLSFAYLEKSFKSVEEAKGIWDLVTALKDAKESIVTAIKSHEMRELMGYREEIKKAALVAPEPKKNESRFSVKVSAAPKMPTGKRGRPKGSVNKKRK